MYSLLILGIFQPAILVYQRVDDFMSFDFSDGQILINDWSINSWSTIFKIDRW